MQAPFVVPKRWASYRAIANRMTRPTDSADYHDHPVYRELSRIYDASRTDQSARTRVASADRLRFLSTLASTLNDAKDDTTNSVPDRPEGHS